MSLAFSCKAVCDGCGVEIGGPPQALVTQCRASYWSLRRDLAKLGWVVLRRPYRRDQHFCSSCSDKPLPKRTKLSRRAA